MEKIKNILGESDLSSMTFFDGRVTLLQVMFAIGAVIIVIAVLALLKKIIFKSIVVLLVCVWLGGTLNLAMPQSLTNAADIVKDKGVEAYDKYTQGSENIRVNDKGSLEVRLEEEWYDIEDVQSIIGKGTVIVNGVSKKTDDTEIVDLLSTFN